MIQALMQEEQQLAEQRQRKALEDEEATQQFLRQERQARQAELDALRDRKSTRLNSSH